MKRRATRISERVNDDPITGRLRELREQAGLTQVQAAKAAGITQWHLSDVETGRSSVSLAALRRLVAQYGVEVALIRASRR